MSLINAQYKEVLIIQTAHIGDVILALPVAQSLAKDYPGVKIHFLVRKGNEILLENHPSIQTVWTLDRSSKVSSVLSLIHELRTFRFDAVINLQRFFTSGLITALIKGKEKIGFHKNPFSFLYKRKIRHRIEPRTFQKGMYHEVDRNLKCIKHASKISERIPKLFPGASSFQKIKLINGESSYYVIAPSSVWFTKALPIHHWIDLCNKLIQNADIYIIGAPSDQKLADQIITQSSIHPKNKIKSLCGQFSLMDSAALIKGAKRLYCNDSAPLHMATAMNTPVSVFFCSTITEFGFGPLSDDSQVLEVKDLDCRPCGIHGKKVCPKGHFKCADEMPMDLVNL